MHCIMHSKKDTKSFSRGGCIAISSKIENWCRICGYLTMMSPQGYLCDILIQNLNNWCENVVEESVKVGILSQNVRLSNLVLREQSWPISKELKICLKYGTLGLFSLQFPLSKIHLGCLNIEVDDIHIVLSIEANDAATEPLSNMEELDSIFIREVQYLNQNAETNKKPSSWLGSYLKSFTQTLLARFIANSTVTVHNVDVSVLIPQYPEKCVHFKFPIQSIVILPKSKREADLKNESATIGKMECFLGKDVSICNFSLYLQYISSPKTAEDYQLIVSQQFGTHNRDSIVLNSTTLSMQLWGKKLRGTPFSMSSIRALVMEASSHNMEWSPSKLHLLAICGLFSSLSAQILRKKVQYFFNAIAGEVLRGKALFQCVAKTILSWVRFRRKGLCAASLYYDVFKLHRERRYRMLYSRILKSRIANFGAYPFKMSDSGTLDFFQRQYEGSDLSESEQIKFSTLCLSINCHEQFQLRKDVHNDILSDRNNHPNVLIAAVLNNPRPKNWLNSFIGDSNSSYLVANAVQNMAIEGYKKEPDEAITLSFEMNICISRLSISIMEPTNTPSEADKPVNNIFQFESRQLSNWKLCSGDVDSKTALSLVVYGICAAVQSDSDSSKSVQVSLGVVKLFGFEGEELLLCGDDSLDWMNMDLNRTGECEVSDRAFHAKFRTFSFYAGHESDADDECVCDAELNVDGKEVHHRYEAESNVFVGFLQVKISTRTVTFIRQLIDAFIAPVSSPQQPLAVYKAQIVDFTDQKKILAASREIETRRHSLDLQVRGVSISVPIEKIASHHSPIRENQTLHRTAAKAMAETPKHYLQLSIGEISILSGKDPLVGPVQVEEKSASVTRITSESAKASLSKASKTSDLKSPALSSKPDDSIEVSKFSKRLLAKIAHVKELPILFSITAISVIFFESEAPFLLPQISKQVVSEPWSISGAYFLGAAFHSLTSRLPIQKNCQNSTEYITGDLLVIDASALICNLSSQSVLDIQSVYNDIFTAMQPNTLSENIRPPECDDATMTDNPYPCIRFLGLADKPILSLDLCFDGLTVKLFEVTAHTETKLETLQNIIYSYCGCLQLRGNKAFVKAVKRSLCLRQLLNMGIDRDNAEKILSESEINVKGEDLATSFERVQTIISSTLPTEPTGATESFRAIICSISISLLCFHSYNLVYDNVTVVSLESILLNDSNHCPMLSVERSSIGNADNYLERSKRQDTRAKCKTGSSLRNHIVDQSVSIRDKASIEYLIDLYENATSGLKISHISKDSDNHFGRGGFKIPDARGEKRIQCIASKYHEVESHSECLEVFFSSTVAAQMLEKISSIIQQIRSSSCVTPSRKVIVLDTADTDMHTLHHIHALNRKTQSVHTLDSYNSGRYSPGESPIKQSTPSVVPFVYVNVNAQSLKITLAAGDNAFVLQTLIQNLNVEIEDVLKSKNQRSSNFRIQRLQLFDLTPLGSMHHEVIWSKRQGRKGEKCAVGSSEMDLPLIEGICQEYRVCDDSNGTDVDFIDISGSVNHLRVCFLYRFIIDIVNYITVYIIDPISKSASKLPVEVFPELAIRTLLDNSETEDDSSSNGSDNDSDVNRLLYNKSVSYSFLSSDFSISPVNDKRNAADCQKPFNSSSPVPAPSPGTSAAQEAGKKDNISSAFNCCFTVNDLTAYGPRNSNSKDCVGVNVETVQLKISQESHPWMAPTDVDLTNNGEILENTSCSLYFDTDTNTWKFSSQIDDETANKKEDFNSINNVLRISLIASSANAFASIFQPLRKSGAEKNHPDGYEEELLFLEIFDKESVYEMTKGSISATTRKSSPHSSQLWQKISSNPFNFRMVLDFTSDQVKLLFSDDEVFSPLNFQVSQSELYLIIAIWSENVCECSQFASDEFSSASGENVKTVPTLHSLVELETAYSTYGSKRYCDFLMHRKDWFELLITRQHVKVKCAIDTNYFPRNIPSDKCLASTQDIYRSDWPSAATSPSKAAPLRRKFSFISGKEWKCRVKPIADIEGSNFLLHLKMDYDCIQMSLSAGDIIVKDLRVPEKSRHDVLFSVHNCSADSAKAGYCSSNFQYGFNLLPSSILTSSKPSHPFQMSLILPSISNWMTINIGLDSSNLNLLNMDMVWLISEFVSCYFRFPEYGHPALTAFEKLKKDTIPYGGIDTRLFVTNPHITLIRHPLQPYSEVLQLETNKGVFFRYALDTTTSVKMELNIYDIAVVLVRRYLVPEKARGLRGASGSGRGIRTLLEYFSLQLIYQFVAEENHLDVKLDCFGHSDEKYNHQFNTGFSTGTGTATACVDLNAEELTLKPGKVLAPTCLISPVLLSTKFRPDSSDIVICYEDFILCNNLFTNFLGLKAQGSKDDATEDEKPKCSIFMVMSVTGVRIMIVDNVLGLHLPLIQVFVDNVATTLFRAKGIESKPKPIEDQSRTMKSIGFSLSKSQSIYAGGLGIDQSDSVTGNDGAGMFAGLASQSNQEQQSKLAKPVVTYPISLSIDLVFSMEYFNNLKKCWEPLLNKLYTTVMFENSDVRGNGYSIIFHNAVHFNLSGALIRTLNDLLRTTQLEESGVADNDEEEGANENESASPWDKRHSCSSHLWNVSDPSSSIYLGGTNSVANYVDVRKPVASNTSDAFQSVSHIKSSPLDPAFRVGFSVYNLTGQGIRYLQLWDGGRITIQYLNDKERGLLNFISSLSSIRNGTLVEVPFDVQLEKGGRKQFRNRKKAVGNRVALQVSGFDWLRSVQADELGIQFYDVTPVLGRRFELQSDDNDTILLNALKMVAEVVPYRGGRMLRLRSVFSIKNNTEHSLNIKIQDDSVDSAGLEVELNEFRLESKGTYFVPLSLLYRSIRANDASGHSDLLGSINIRPADLPPIINGLQKNSVDSQPLSVDYSTDPINLYQNIVGVSQVSDGDDLGGHFKDLMQLRCDVKSHLDSVQTVSRGAFNMKTFTFDTDRAPRFPPVCYNVEIIRETSDAASEFSNTRSDKTNLLTALFPLSTKDSKSDFKLSPKCYTIVIHPPIILENLLPVDAVFEILHATHKTVLWSSQLKSEAIVSIHTVTLDQPLSLMIKANYCCASEGIIFHEPNIQQKKSKKVGNWKTDFEAEILDVILSDTVGQRLRVHVENIEGGGGQRHLIVFCPFLILNTSQYSFRIREEGHTNLPAGTVSEKKDGSREMPGSNITAYSESNIDNENNVVMKRSVVQERLTQKVNSPYDLASSVSSSNDHNDVIIPPSGSSKTFENSRTFPGKISAFHSNSKSEVSMDWRKHHFLETLTFEEIKNYSYMFNYSEASSYILGGRKVKVQFDDSNWSSPFSLDSVGVNQVISINHKTGCCEAGFNIMVAPGKMSKYTKIVRFLPHYTIVNNLSTSIRIFQPSGFAGQDLESEVLSGCIRPYHLPSVNGRRNIGVKIEGPWNSTVAFPIDRIGTYVMSIRKQLPAVHHVNTRGEAVYTVPIPQDCSKLGLWLETDWGAESILVKRIKPGSFAANCTKIHIGDVLIAINDLDVTRKSFNEVMEEFNKISSRGNNFLKFRTLEERLKLIREMANSKSSVKRANTSVEPVSTTMKKALDDSSKDQRAQDEFKLLKVEFRQFESSVAISVDEVSDDSTIEYRIDNKSLCYMLYYKQKGIVGNKWYTLNPGQTSPFAWEDPFGPHRLSIIVGHNVLAPYSSPDMVSSSSLFLFSAEQNSAIFDFDKSDKSKPANSIPIQFRDPKHPKALQGIVKSGGHCKILEVSPIGDKDQYLMELDYCRQFCENQLIAIENFQEKVVETIQNSYERNEIVATETIREIKSFQPKICNSLEEDYVSKQVEAALAKKDSESVEDTMFRAVEKLQMEELARLGCAEMNQLLPSDLRNLEAHVQSYKNVETLKMMAPEMVKNIEQEAKLKYDAAQLVSYIPFEKMFESGLSAQNQLMVNVLEARDLTPTVVGKVEDVYCKVYLDLRNSTVPNIFRNWRRAYRTYICEQTMDPSWLYQNFLLELPANAKMDSRQLYIRVDVLAQSSIGLDQVLGRADIQLSSLENEKELSGWFPLRYNSNSALLNEDGYAESMTGSIKLTLQWIHSLKGLTDHYFEASYRRLLELQLHKKVLNFCNDFHRKTETFKTAEPKLKENKNFKRDNYYMMHLRNVKNLSADEYLEKRLAGASISRSSDSTRYSLRVNFNDDQTQKNIIFGLVQSSPSIDVTHERVGKGFMSVSRDTVRLRSESHCGGLETMSKGRKSKAKFHPLLLGTSPTTVGNVESLSNIFFSHDKAYRNWAEQFYVKYNHIHQSMKKFMLRSSETVEEETVFVKRFDEECKKTFLSLHLLQGMVEVTPLQAQNLPDSRNAVFVRISYGEEKFDTISMPPASFLSWHQERMDDNFSHYTSNLKDGDNKQKFTNAGSFRENTFSVDSLNIKGNIKVRIMAEGFPKATTLAEVNIPVFNLLQCICDGKDFYEKWFPLTLFEDIVVGEGELEKLFSSYATEQISTANLGYKPCINLRLRWIPSEKSDEDPESEVSKMYCRFQMPALTVAVIDSDKAAELLQVSLMGLELRRTVTENITNTNVNITWVQVDNELPDTQAPVIMCPTFQKYPQPVVRLHFRENNNHENKNIDSYHSIQLCIQELDVKLEQQTVLASWDLLKGWLDERKSDHEGNVLYSESDIMVKSNSDLGYHPHVEKKNLLSDGFKLLESYESFLNRKSSTGTNDEDRKISVDKFVIHPVKLNVSFITSPHVLRKQTSTRQQTVDIRNQGIIGLYSTLSMFIWQVGEVILSLTSTISNTSIEFSGFIIDDMFNKSASETQQIIQDHYLNAAWRQLYKIVGSLELVGVNPIGLLSSLSIGVVSFFYEPAHAIITSPTEFRKIGKGVFKGTVSLVSNVSVGLLGTSIGVTQSAGRIASKVTMDESYMKAREKLQRPPRTLGGVITRPMKDIGTGVYYASTGLVKLPYVGYTTEGIPGLVKGAGKGLGGAFTKPVVGIFDACSHSFSGAKDLIDVVTINSAHPVPRLRLSDLFGPDGRILPYNYASSLGFYLLQLLEQSNEEEFVSTAIHDGMGILNMCGKVFESSPAKNRTSPSEPGTVNRSSRRGTRRYSTVTKPSRIFSSQDVSKYLTTQKLDEYVISTSLFRDSEKKDKAVVITTFRVVVMGFKRHNLRSTFNALWECPLDYLVEPQLRRISGEIQFTFKLLNPSPKGSVISEFMERAVHSSRIKKTTGHYEYTLTCKENDEEVFYNMENTINVILRNYSCVSDKKIVLNHNASTLCEKVEEGRVDIGAWQYIDEETYYADTVVELQQDFSQEGLNYEVYEELGLEPWKVSSILQSNVPNWLKEEQHEAEQAHRNQQCYQTVCDSIRQTTSESARLVEKFERGEITPDEFLRQAECFRSCSEASESNNEDTSKCSESDSKYKKKVAWSSIGRSVLSFAVHSGQSINSNISKLVSRSKTGYNNGSQLTTDKDTIADTVNDRHSRSGIQVCINSDNKEPIVDVQDCDEIPDDESYSTCASSARGLMEKSEIRSAAKSAFSVVDEDDLHHDNDSLLKMSAVVPAIYSRNSDNDHNEDHSALPMESNSKNPQRPPQQNQHAMKINIETTENPSRPQQLLTAIPKPNASRHDKDLLTSHNHAHHHRPSGLLAEVNPMIANKLPPNPAKKDGIADCIVSSGISASQEVNYDDIYSSLQVVNGVVSSPPARLVDAVAAPVDSADLTILLLNERINRLENIILALHPTSSFSIPSSAESNTPPQSSQVHVRALEFSENANLHNDARNEASYFDYLVDRMPHSSSLDPTTSSPQANSTEEIDSTDN